MQRKLKGKKEINYKKEIKKKILINSKEYLVF